MKKVLLLSASAFLFFTLCQTSMAWRPTGWVWTQWPWSFSLDSSSWYYMNEADLQLVHGYAPADGWDLMARSGLASGWAWHSWPFAFDSEIGAWFYVLESSVQWVNNRSTDAWTRFGQTPEPPAPTGMSLIPAGAFVMGDTFGEGGSDELPLHTNYISGFYMDQYEVTKALWDEVKAFNGGNGYSYSYTTGQGKATNHPVHTVNWFDAVKWCNARSEMEGLTPVYYTDAGFTTAYKTGEIAPFANWSANGYRLPTEAEWEKAARGGVAGQRFPWGDTISHSNANYTAYPAGYSYDVSPTSGYHPTFYTASSPYTSPVGYFAPNGYGLYDMSGNLREWCWDWYSSSYYSSSPSTDPQGPSSGSYRVLRGGSWSFLATDSRVANRYYFNPDYVSDDSIGFRCARGL